MVIQVLHCTCTAQQTKSHNVVSPASPHASEKNLEELETIRKSSQLVAASRNWKKKLAKARNYSQLKIKTCNSS